MKRLLCILFIAVGIAAIAGEPFCIQRTFDERDGLSQSLVKQVVQDRDGFIWVATWNGLNRFDGYDFITVRPSVDSEVRRFSSRIGDIKLDGDGNLWLRIDSRVVFFNTSTYDFTDVHRDIERKLGRNIEVKSIMATVDGIIVIETKDGRYITMTKGGPRLNASRPSYRYQGPSNRRLNDVKPYTNDELVYSGADRLGGKWLITRQGEILYSPSDATAFKEIDRIKFDGTLYFAITDNSGNLWLRSNSGLHRVTIGSDSYKTVAPPPGGSMLRTSMSGADGRLWLSWSDTRQVAVYTPSLKSPLWLGRDGSLTPTQATLGIPVYSMACHGQDVWLGSKPDGLYRLKPSGDNSYTISHIVGDDAIYDITTDRRGRMWIASMLHGIGLIDNPASDTPAVRRLSEIKGYPADATKVRRIIVIGDSMVVAATTGGLLTVKIPADGKSFNAASFRLHVSCPGDNQSLGNVAVMDVDVTSSGLLLAATESDGINYTDNLAASIFRRFNRATGAPTDVAYNVMPVSIHGGDRLLATSNRFIYLFSPGNTDVNYLGQPYFHRDITFSDARPLPLADGKSYLFGLTDGAVVLDLSSAVRNDTPDKPARIVFTAVSFSGQADMILTPATDTVTITPDRRNFTLSFASLEYSYPELTRYHVKINDGEWTLLNNDRDITFADIKPGKYLIHVRSTDPRGRLLDNERVITVIVTPTFGETGWAKALYILVILLVATAVYLTIRYIRHIKLRQRQILDAYLGLLEQNKRIHDTDAATPAVTSEPSHAEADPLAQVDQATRAMLDRVVSFVEQNLDNSDITVDDMAAAAATSRSGLTRKMKQIMGITPSEFIKASRLTRAEHLLVTTDMSVKEIAAATGFSDLNYLGKCFKARYSLTPTDYRKSHRQ